jgi:hypothetical protein
MRTYDRRPVATKSIVRKVPKKRSAVPRSLRRTTMSITAASSTSIGRKYGSGGIDRNPIRRRALVSRVRVSARYPAMKTTSTILRNSPGCTLIGPRSIQSRAPFTS